MDRNSSGTSPLSVDHVAMSRRCEECRAVLDPTKILRCTKCKACCYCSRECQTRNWRIHKRVCSTDPALRPFIRVEMAVERALTKQPPMEQAPKDAFCYICLEGDGKSKSSKLMRGCACRGDSAGFVHLECLTKLAMSKEASGDLNIDNHSWLICGNCKQPFTGALGLEMTRRFWRYLRSTQDLTRRYNSMRTLATILSFCGQIDAASELLEEASTYVGNDKTRLGQINLLRANALMKNNRNLEALGLLQANLPELKACAAISTSHLYGQTMLESAHALLHLGRYQEAHETTSEIVPYAKVKFGLENPVTLKAMRAYAAACAELGRVEEAKATFADVLATQTRVLGRDHFNTQSTRRCMRSYGFAVPSG